MRKLFAVAIVALLASGCGGEEGEKDAGEEAAAPELFAWPAKTFAEVKLACAQGADLLDEKTVAAFCECSRKLAGLKKKHAGDQQALKRESEAAIKASGFAGYADYLGKGAQMLACLAVLQQMQTLERMEQNMSGGGPAAAALAMSRAQMLEALSKAIRDVKLSEADLRLAHKYNRELVGSLAGFDPMGG